MKYRVWNSINAPNEMHTYRVNSIDEAKKLIDKLTIKQLKDQDIFDNAFGLEVREDNTEWEEWYDEYGDSILEVMENENDNRRET